MSRLRRISKTRASRLLIALLWALAVSPSIAVADEPAQIFKCTDKSGNVTYQNEPCPKDSKAGRIDLFDNRWSATREEREAEWQRSASQHQVLSGMPARWVREALGEPTEVRNTPTAGAAQLWLYNLRDRSIQIGMLNDQVLWFRESPTASSTTRVVPPTDRPAAGPQAAASNANAASRPPSDLPVMRLVPSESDRIAEAHPAGVARDRPATQAPDLSAGPSIAPSATTPSGNAAAPAANLAASAGNAATGGESAAKSPRSVTRGQDCKQALADLGPPDRQRELPALDAGADPAIEYLYESAAGAGRLRIVCANGKVEGVDRSVAR